MVIVLAPFRKHGPDHKYTEDRTLSNALMARLQDALQAERRFAANAAHELRTPIAAALAQAQRLQQEAQDPATNDRAEQIVSSLSRLARLSEKLLQLSRAEGGAVRASSDQKLGKVIRLVIEELDRNGSGHLSLSMPEGDVFAPINPDAYAILLRKLVENALRHGTQGQPVEVRVNADASLRVTNDAEVIPPETLTQLGEPFRRGPTGADGSGLCLSIARAIASAAGGRHDFKSPIPGSDRGFVAEFTPQGRNDG